MESFSIVGKKTSPSYTSTRHLLHRCGVTSSLGKLCFADIVVIVGIVVLIVIVVVVVVDVIVFFANAYVVVDVVDNGAIVVDVIVAEITRVASVAATADDASVDVHVVVVVGYIACFHAINTRLP